MADYKGGYQIIDLSNVTVGTQATIRGIYNKVGGNNTKPIMIITPDGQRVFAEVKAGTNKYVTAYLGADGATYTVEISNANEVDITKQESDASIATKVAALELSDLDPNSVVNLSEYDGSTDAKHFIVPSDGIITIGGSAENSTLNVRYHYNNDTEYFSIALITGNTTVMPVFVKKGLRLYVIGTNSGFAIFRPFTA